ncbi:uncharacterized protein DS421_19g649460 [Arachis hypogaea]|uniref:Uncharacterized protein n=2 Tax=Arachis TaxID=3817 RepID=A0A6B9V6V8_ARAHY|nr:uncharacterized protein DS421_19g649460 [Arachis hypogaea]
MNRAYCLPAARRKESDGDNRENGDTARRRRPQSFHMTRGSFLRQRHSSCDGDGTSTRDAYTRDGAAGGMRAAVAAVAAGLRWLRVAGLGG